jgi:hypothetical protein
MHRQKAIEYDSPLLSFSSRHEEGPVNQIEARALACFAAFDQTRVSPFNELSEFPFSHLSLIPLQEVMGIAVPSTLRSRVLETLKPSERWVVFVGPYEHHSNLLTWRQSLADVIEAPLTADGVLDMTYLETELQSER